MSQETHDPLEHLGQLIDKATREITSPADDAIIDVLFEIRARLRINENIERSYPSPQAGANDLESVIREMGQHTVIDGKSWDWRVKDWAARLRASIAT